MPCSPYPRREDVESVDAILGALHDVISGPAETPRDWDRFRSLFAPDARLIRVIDSPRQPGGAEMEPMDLDTFIQFFESELGGADFYERESTRHVEAFGHIAHSFSTYESRREIGGIPFQRGINSIQLFQDQGAWRFVTILWDFERPECPIPARYLPGESQREGDA